MPWLQADPLQRFTWPIPWYKPSETDDMFETRGFAVFARRRKDSPWYLLTTEDLSVLIEEEDVDLDPGFEFTGAEVGVLGKTIFRRHETLVRISRLLADDSSLENIYRMTFAHECGHVVLHRHVYEPCFDRIQEMEEVYRGHQCLSCFHTQPTSWPRS
jgi:hypothetical protein